jgi:hypothetical protein
MSAIGEVAHGTEFVVGSGKGGLQAGDLAVPTALLGLGDPGFEVHRDLSEAVLLWSNSQDLWIVEVIA